MKEYIIPQIEIRKGNIATIVVDAIVNPANSFGYMGGGVALAIKTLGGEEIEEEAISLAPIQVGEAVFTSSGVLAAKKVIHAPTMHDPVEKTDVHKISCAVEAALSLADKEGLKSIAFPSMGTGVGMVSKKDAAKAMIDEIRKFKFENVEKIILIGKDEETVKEFESALKKEKSKI